MFILHYFPIDQSKRQRMDHGRKPTIGVQTSTIPTIHNSIPIQISTPTPQDSSLTFTNLSCLRWTLEVPFVLPIWSFTTSIKFGLESGVGWWADLSVNLGGEKRLRVLQRFLGEVYRLRTSFLESGKRAMVRRAVSFSKYSPSPIMNRAEEFHDVGEDARETNEGGKRRRLNIYQTCFMNHCTRKR